MHPEDIGIMLMPMSLGPDQRIWLSMKIHIVEMLRRGIILMPE